MSYTRFAVYDVPRDAALSEFGARWLGWDIERGIARDMFEIDALDDITLTPRKYGFHGTLKPPFRLADGTSLTQLQGALKDLTTDLRPIKCDGLTLTKLGRFLALTPTGDLADLRNLAEHCVKELDPFRAAPIEAELQRRRKANLNSTQEANLLAWGYPYVMEEFRFHLTLTGALAQNEIDHWAEVAINHVPDLSKPYEIHSLALCGERQDGHFEIIHRYALGA